MEEEKQSRGSSATSPLIPPPSEIDLEAGGGDQLQCRICLETDGRDFIAPCKCKGTSKFVHRDCLDHWRAVKEGFAFSHCTTCKAPYYLRVHVHTDRKWRTLKFRFFVTRDILFIFVLVQLVISALAYLVHFVDGYQQYWLRTAWGFDNEVSFYYICGALLFFALLGLSGCFITCYDRRVRSDLAHPCRELCMCCCQPGMCADCHLPGTLCMWTDCTTCFEGCASTAGECGGCLGGAGEAGLPLMLIEASTTREVELKLNALEAIAVVSEARRVELLPVLPNLERLELHGVHRPKGKTAAVALANLLRCCPALLDLHIKLTTLQHDSTRESRYSREFLERKFRLDLEESIDRWNHCSDPKPLLLYPLEGADYYVEEVSEDIPALSGHSFHCLKRVCLQFRMEKPTSCLGTKLLKFFAENAVDLEEICVDAGNEKMWEHINTQVERWIANSAKRRNATYVTSVLPLQR